MAAHCLTVWASAIIPFKIGEIPRLAGFSIAVKSPFGGGGIWLIERLSDAVALVILVIGLSLFLPVAREAIVTLSITGGFISACALGGWILVEIIPFLRNHLVLRSRTPKGLFALKVVHQVELAMAQVRRLLTGRFSLTLLISLLIWSLEFMAVIFWGSTAGAGADLIAVLLSDQREALAQRTPVFAAFTLIGVAILGGVVMKRWRFRHA
ncbi:MAG: hypothetical protein Q8R02_08635 [Hyphomonadaceae bacterium]|nr:hypothetical protein [Hyphomonadaceae bacterium]